MEPYSKLLFLVIGLKIPRLSFLRFLSFIDSQIQTCINLDSGRVKQGSTQYNEDQIFFNSNAGEPKGRDVSEGLIGSDTTGKLSGLHHVLSFIANKVLKYPGREGKLRGRERGRKIPDDWNANHSLLINWEPGWEIKICSRTAAEGAEKCVIKYQWLARARTVCEAAKVKWA